MSYFGQMGPLADAVVKVFITMTYSISTLTKKQIVLGGAAGAISYAVLASFIHISPVIQGGAILSAFMIGHASRQTQLQPKQGKIKVDDHAAPADYKLVSIQGPYSSVTNVSFQKGTNRSVRNSALADVGDRSISVSQLVHAMDLLQDDVWIINTKTQQFRYMNCVARERLNWDTATYLEKGLAGIANPTAVRTVLDEIDALHLGTSSDEPADITLDNRTLQVRVSRLSDDKDSHDYIVILRDITVYVDHERNNAQFVSTVSHELRSPLTSIKGAMGLLLANPTDHLSDKAHSLVEIAHRNAERLVLIANDILDLEKIAAGNMTFTREMTDLTSVVREAVQTSTTLAQSADVNLVLDIDDAPLWIATDMHRILQVLNNLLTNAIKFSPPHANVDIAMQTNDETVTITVTDHGQGIDKEDHHKIFERFADFKNSNRAVNGGTGLGLSICKLIIDNLNGTIGFKSETGAGTSFYFVLPRKEIDSAAPKDSLSPRLVS